jgi:site-specific recombinase XerD
MHGLDQRVERNSAIGASGSGTRTILQAVSLFLRHYGEIGQEGKFRGDGQYSTWRIYRAKLRFLQAFCTAKGIVALADVNLEVLEDFRPTRHIGPVTWKVELQALRTFFGFCVRHKWISSNPAKELNGPRNIKPNEVVPYTPNGESQILAACAKIGGGKYNRSGARYEQLRARAMIMLLRHTALRISDVYTLRKDAITWDGGKSTWRVCLRTQKTGD